MFKGCPYDPVLESGKGYKDAACLTIDASSLGGKASRPAEGNPVSLL
jgi:hypothetical protein